MEELRLFVDSLQQFWLQIAAYLPRALAAVLFLLAGWLIAKLLRRGVVRFFKMIRLDALAEKSGIEGFLIQGGVKYTMVTILANIIYWFVMLTVTLAVLNSLGLDAAAQLFNKFVLYIPNVVVALLLLVFGSLFARFIRGVSYAYMENIGLEGSEILSVIAQWAILLFAVSAALEQLAIGGQVLVSAFQISFGALCLAIAIAFGLGGKDWAARILDRMWKK
jgi:hypothetical protein